MMQASFRILLALATITNARSATSTPNTSVNAATAGNTGTTFIPTNSLSLSSTLNNTSGNTDRASPSVTKTTLSITPSPSQTWHTSVPTTKKADDDSSEPKVSLYIWQIVACGAGGLTLVLLIIITILSLQNRLLRKRMRTMQNHSVPIKENGAWIENQDIPLWQKRASVYNVQENPAAEQSTEQKECSS